MWRATYSGAVLTSQAGNRSIRGAGEARADVAFHVVPALDRILGVLSTVDLGDFVLGKHFAEALAMQDYIPSVMSQSRFVIIDFKAVDRPCE